MQKSQAQSVKYCFCCYFFDLGIYNLLKILNIPSTKNVFNPVPLIQQQIPVMKKQHKTKTTLDLSRILLTGARVSHSLWLVETVAPKCWAVLTFIDYHVMKGLTGIASVQLLLRGKLTHRPHVASPRSAVLLIVLWAQAFFLKVLSQFSVCSYSSICAWVLLFNLSTLPTVFCFPVKKMNFQLFEIKTDWEFFLLTKDAKTRFQS